LLFAPCLTDALLEVPDLYPLRAFQLSLQQEQLKHALIGSKNAFKRISGEVCRQRLVFGRVLNLEELMLSVGNRHFKAIFSRNKLAFEPRDVFESGLTEVIELDYHAL
jgi:hypothetical protein